MNETQVASGSGPLYKRTKKMFSHIGTALKEVREKKTSLMIVTDHLLHPIKFNSGQKSNFSIVYGVDDHTAWTRTEVDKVRTIIPQILKTLDDNPELRIVFTENTKKALKSSQKVIVVFGWNFKTIFIILTTALFSAINHALFL